MRPMGTWPSAAVLAPAHSRNASSEIKPLLTASAAKARIETNASEAIGAAASARVMDRFATRLRAATAAITARLRPPGAALRHGATGRAEFFPKRTERG